MSATTLLHEATGSKLAPSYYITATALLSLASLVLLRRGTNPLQIAKREPI